MSLLRGSSMEAFAQPLAIALIAFTLGYQVRNLTSSSNGSGVGLLFRSTTKANKKRKLSPLNNGEPATKAVGAENTDSEGEGLGATDTDSDAEDEAEAKRSAIAEVKASGGEEVKLVLVVNDSLKMQKGKIAAQAGHATLACALMLQAENPRLYRKWQMQGQPKIALRCASTEELESLATQARRLNLCARTIQDAGRTQVAPGSKTILGIGPGPARLINTVTGKLKLL